MIISTLIGTFLAYANGSNDNFKGVATLFGSESTTYKKALLWATVTTVAGSLTALFLAGELVARFSGKGLVPDAVLDLSYFSASVALSAALTVVLATRYGFPISTTHALTGGLVGAGLVASAQGIDLSKLGANFFMPLIVSPIVALVVTLAIYPLLKWSREFLGVTKETCICVGGEMVAVPTNTSVAAYVATLPTVTVGTTPKCIERYEGKLVGLSAGSSLDFFHFLSAGSVGFARGLNDTPKIAAILLAGKILPTAAGIALVSIAMAIGGWLNSYKIAETMSKKITTMSAGQGFSANLVTSLIVIFASKLGMPVSTTHVSCGSLFGLGTATGKAQWKTILNILMAWVITLPVAGVLAALCALGLKGILN